VWPEIALPADAPQWVRDLRDQGRWLEQEIATLDDRLRRAVEDALVV
jgi:hypothetical protein